MKAGHSYEDGARDRESLCREESAVVLDAISDGVFTIDQDFKISFFNRAAERITGVNREEALGCSCWEVFRTNICEQNCVLRRTFEQRAPVMDEQVVIVRADGRRIPISVSTGLLLDTNGAIIGGVETFRDITEIVQLRKEVEARFSFEDMISRNHRMHELFAILPEIAESESTVLIEGESGTGKELLARALHNLSPRRTAPLVAVNCGALPDTLLESELFGYEAGAFTDARRRKPGRFAMAEGGSLFLDEIADVSPAMQIRLLRVLQERTYEPLGATSSIQSDVRILAATNKDLEEEMRAGRFRQDLYYRINIIRIVLPPLRERKEDIPLLAAHIIERMSKLRNKHIEQISRDALSAFMRHDWPGNIRELENAIEHAFILCHEEEIQLRHLPRQFIRHGADDSLEGQPATLQEVEEAAIRRALERNDWRRSATAAELGIDASTLWRKMKRLRLTPPAS
ncbi:sigma 54-interacting transcriptional regulator [bacterium]|nr:sigma 54-interacting transcriptional regulator [candidate division CSSED10-310 bacterium]